MINIATREKENSLNDPLQIEWIQTDSVSLLRSRFRVVTQRSSPQRDVERCVTSARAAAKETNWLYAAFLSLRYRDCRFLNHSF